MSTLELVMKTLGEEAVSIIKDLLKDSKIKKKIKYYDCLKKYNLYGNEIQGMKFGCDHLLEDKETSAISEGSHCCKWCGRHFNDDEMKLISNIMK